MSTRSGRFALIVALALVALAGCAGQPPINTQVKATVPLPGGAQVVTSPPKPENTSCGDPTASLRPASSQPAPGQMPAGTTMQRIAQRGKLIVGVDQNTYKVGYRDPATGTIEGFDIDMAHDVAKAIFGDPNRIQLRALTSAQRLTALVNGDVDMVVRTMSITCDRELQVAFSSVYYVANQRVLAKKNSGITSMASLAGKKVCATSGSTSLPAILNAPSKPTAVAVTDWTDCLVMLQQDQVDAVSTDDTILAGMAAQDRYTQLVGPPISAEPYGIAIPKQNTDMVRFVNGVLDQIRSNGSWTASYDKWLAGLLGPAPAPPQPRYRD
ncbi:glutamate ABC transporter substrate-binding protein [Fodinicola feengrottensis]|uniref:Glutamate ABC transporter substrate-binding protein n=1 Tax=Fodinicola feengrottensis TaxID=435914 RepID=A0ABN2IQU8_9ACTN|nr:glutamate ABC transporter substrate-binding protein [Fodinicola feengrottensis]